jgi:hypothetical protein
MLDAAAASPVEMMANRAGKSRRDGLSALVEGVLPRVR